MSRALPMSVDSLLAETDWLRALCRQLVRDTDRAEDLFQDTVLAGLRDAGQRRGAVRPWLAGVARNLVANQRRAAQRAEARERSRARAAAEASTLDAVARVGAQRRVLEAVEQLPEEQCEAVLLRYLEDLPPREIAARLDLPLGTVKTRLKRGLASLRERLDAEYGERAEWIAVLTPLASGAGLVSAGGGVAAAGTAWAGGRLLRTALVLVALGACGAVLAWAPWTDGPAPATSDPRIASAGLPAAAADAEASDPKTSDPADLRAGAEDPAARRPADPPAVEEPASAEGNLRLVLRDAATDEPVGDVDVYLQIRSPNTPPDPQERERERRMEAGLLTAFDVMKQVCAHHTTPSSGELLVPFTDDPDAMLLVYAHDATREVFVQMPASEVEQVDLGHRLVLSMQPRCYVDVAVVDREGAPVADCPVAYLLGPQLWNTARTGASGEAARIWLPALPEEYRGYGGVVVLLVGGSAEPLPVGEDRLNGEPVELVRPDAGTVEVVAVDAAGKRVVEPVTAILFGKREGLLPEGLPFDVTHDELARVEAEGGVARFEAVALGRGYAVRASVAGHAAAWVSEAFDGPAADGRQVRVEVRPATGTELGALQLSGPDGRVLGHADVTLRHGRVVDGFLVSAATESGTTDAQGVIRSAALHGKGRVGADRAVEVQWQREGQAPSGARVMLAGSGAEPGRPVECILRPTPCLAAGRVVDDGGRPLGAVQVSVRAPGSDTVQLGPVYSDETTGRFALFGFGDPEAVEIVAERDGLGAVRSGAVRPGRQDHELVMVAGRTVRGVVDSGGGESSLRVALAPADPTREPLEAPVDEVAFAFEAVPPGRYELRVSLLGVGVLSRTSVDVPPGPRDKEVMLEAVTITEGFRRVTVTALDPEGRPVSELWIGFGIGRAMHNAPTDDEGRLTLLLPPEGATLQVADPAWQPIRREDVLEDQVLRLERRR